MVVVAILLVERTPLFPRTFDWKTLITLYRILSILHKVNKGLSPNRTQSVITEFVGESRAEKNVRSSVNRKAHSPRIPKLISPKSLLSRLIYCLFPWALFRHQVSRRRNKKTFRLLFSPFQCFLGSVPSVVPYSPCLLLDHVPPFPTAL